MFLYMFNIFLLCIEFFQLLGKSILAIFESLLKVFVPPLKKSVEGEIVLITGAGHGLGRYLALLFADLGARVVLWDINKENIENVKREIQSRDGIAYGYVCDVSKEKNVETVALQVRREIGDVAILINNAGIMHCQPLLCLNGHQIRKTLEVNTLSHFWTVRQFLPRMLELGHGHIVAIASIAGLLGSAYMSDFCVSKFGVVGLMKSLSEELHSLRKEEYIQLTTVCPVSINTGGTKCPKTRFPRLIPVLEVDTAAQKIVDAILCEQNVVIIPSRVELVIRTFNLLPVKVSQMIQHFLGYSIDPLEARN